jgi:hypothetical protein
VLDHLFESADEERERETVDGFAEGFDYMLGAETRAEMRDHRRALGSLSSSHNPGALLPSRVGVREAHPARGAQREVHQPVVERPGSPSAHPQRRVA